MTNKDFMAGKMEKRLECEGRLENVVSMNVDQNSCHSELHLDFNCNLRDLRRLLKLHRSFKSREIYCIGTRDCVAAAL